MMETIEDATVEEEATGDKTDQSKSEWKQYIVTEYFARQDGETEQADSTEQMAEMGDHRRGAAMNRIQAIQTAGTGARSPVQVSEAGTLIYEHSTGACTKQGRIN